MWMNRADIDNAVDILTREAHPALPYARYLRDWRDIVDQHSDGWPYWRGGSRAAEKLTTLLSGMLTWNGVRVGATPLTSEFNRALTPIKACATRHKLPHPVLDKGIQLPLSRSLTPTR